MVEADGNPIRNENDLVRAINAKKDGDVQLTIVRSGKRQTITVTPEASKEGGFLGIGGVRVSEAEKATLKEISSALKLAA